MKNTVNTTKGFKRVFVGMTAAVMAMTCAASLTSVSGITASATYYTTQSASNDAIDDYFDSLDYNEDAFFANTIDADGDTMTQMVQGPDGSIMLIKKQKLSDCLTTRNFGVANADYSNIYPGALLKADEGLVTGNPEPIRLPRRKLAISIPNTCMKDGASSKIMVNPTNASYVNDALNTLRSNFKEDADFAAQMTARVEKVESEQQIKAKMNFSNEMWANLKVNASADYQNNNQAVVVDISHVFYTVTADVQTSADLFPENATLPRIQKEITSKTPAVEVSTVDYGKRVVACIQTDDTSFDLKAAVEASGLGGKVKGGAEGEYESKLKKCTVKLCIIGGSSENAGKYITTNIADLMEVVKSNTKYDGYAVPVSYTTRWAKSGKIASSNYSGYTWKTVATQKLTDAMPVHIKFDYLESRYVRDKREKIDLLTKGNIKIYGRKIIGIADDGSYIKSEDQLLKDLSYDYGTTEDFKLPADVLLDSVRIVFSYEGEGEMSPEKYRTLRLNDVMNSLYDLKYNEVEGINIAMHYESYNATAGYSSVIGSLGLDVKKDVLESKYAGHYKFMQDHPERFSNGATSDIAILTAEPVETAE